MHNVISSAGSGKSTYCASLYQHCQALGRTIHIVNLDPVAEHFNYPVALDIRELTISLDDVMEELGFGPNGSLRCYMDNLQENIDGWLMEELENYMDDGYLVFNCPGPIELFSYVPVLQNFVEHLKCTNFNVCAVFLLDSQLELAHVNIISKVDKVDLVTNKRGLQDYLNLEPQILLSKLNGCMGLQFAKLNKSLIELFEDDEES